MRALALLFFALLPSAALASGFHLPWWGEALYFLLLSPVGWAVSALLLTALVTLIVFVARRRKYKARP